MTSSDREILISINHEIHRINNRLDSLDARVSSIENRVGIIEHRLDSFEVQLTRNTDKIDWLQTTIYWGFAIIAFIAAVIPSWTSRKNDNDKPIIIQTPSPPQPHISYSDIKEIVKLEIAQSKENTKASS